MSKHGRTHVPRSERGRCSYINFDYPEVCIFLCKSDNARNNIDHGRFSRAECRFGEAHHRTGGDDARSQCHSGQGLARA